MRQTRLSQELGPLNHPAPQESNRDQKLLTLDEINERWPNVTYRELKAKREGLEVANRGHRIISPNQVEFNVRSHSDADHQPTPSPNEEFVPAHNTENNGQTLDSNVPVGEESTGEVSASERMPTENCAICLEFLEDDDDVRELQCHHYFHQPCIDQWLTNRRGQCPLCKRDCVDLEPPTRNRRRSSNNPSPPPRTAIPRLYSRYSTGGGRQTQEEVSYLGLITGGRSQTSLPAP